LATQLSARADSWSATRTPLRGNYSHRLAPIHRFRQRAALRRLGIWNAWMPDVRGERPAVGAKGPERLVPRN